jgi:hypothetical protein
MNRTLNMPDTGAARVRAAVSSSYRQKPIKFLRVRTRRSQADAISAADAARTEALMCCILELMQYHRAALG